MGTRLNRKAYHLVCRGNRKRLRLLLRKHADLRTPGAGLVHAAYWGNRGMLRWLLERGVSPDDREFCTGSTPLMSAAAHGDLGVMKVLLEFGADPNALNNESENPLGFAVAWQQPEAIKRLVAAGAYVNNTEDSGPERTQLDTAELAKWSEGVAVLRALGGKRYKDLIRDAETG